MHVTSSNIAAASETNVDDDIIDITGDDSFSLDDILKNIPEPKKPLVDIGNVPIERRFTYEFAAELTGCTVDDLKAARVFELHVPLNHRPKRSEGSRGNTANREGQMGTFSDINAMLLANLDRSPPKLSFPQTPFTSTFTTAGIQPVPMSPSINAMMLTGNVPTHSTPSLSNVGPSLAVTVTRHTKEQVNACRRNFNAQHNQTMSLDTGVLSVGPDNVVASTTMVLDGNKDEPDFVTVEDDPSPSLMVGKRGEKLNRTFTKEDLLLMKQQNGATEQPSAKQEGATSDEESESLSVGHPETMTSSSSAEFQQQQQKMPSQDKRVQPQIVDQQAPVVPLQPKQTKASTGIARPSGLPAPAFTSRLMQPKVYSSHQQMSGSNPSLVGSTSSLVSNGSKGADNEQMGAPPPLQRAGTFTKEQHRPSTATTQNAGTRKQTMGVLPNKITAPSGMARASMAQPGIRRNQTTGSNLNQHSMSVHAVRYSGRPSAAGRRK